MAFKKNCYYLNAKTNSVLIFSDTVAGLYFFLDVEDALAEVVLTEEEASVLKEF